jgi:hypothetical protein
MSLSSMMVPCEDGFHTSNALKRFATSEPTVEICASSAHEIAVRR